MITKFNTLKKIGIFKNFIWNNSIPEFTKVNIIFGYNGSGKSTISNVFNLFSSKYTNPDELYNHLANESDSNIEITLNNKKIKYTSKSNKKNIYVFNYNFIKDHVFDGSKANFKKFDTASVTTEQLKNPKIQKIEDDINDLADKRTKKQFKIKNYDKQFQDIKKKYTDEFNDKIPNSRFSEKVRIEKSDNNEPVETIKNNLDKIYNNYKLSSTNTSKIDTDLKTLQELTFSQPDIPEKKLIESISTTLKTQSHDKIKEKVEKHSNLNHDWYKKGLEVLKKLEKNTHVNCPLCDSDIKNTIKNLIINYESYFSNEYDNLIQNLNLFKVDLEKHKKIILNNNKNIPTLTPLFTEYSPEFLPFESLFEPVSDKLNILIEILLYLLDSKKNNPFEDIKIDSISQSIKDKNPKYYNRIIIEGTKIDDILQIFKNLITDYNKIIEKANLLKKNLLSKLNTTLSNPEHYKKEAKKLVKNLILKTFDDSNNKNQINNYLTCINELKNITEKTKTLEIEKHKEIAKIKDESRYVNDYLKRLGIHHFNITISNKEKDNITINYNSGIEKKGISHSLSEGEKTALAFAYFLSKIKYEIIDASGKKLSDTIIVIDDPVSSLDDNRLYSTSILIIDTFIEAKQLFILSHNLIFLKYFGANIPKPREDFFLSIYPAPALIKLPEALNKYSTVYFSKIKDIQAYVDDKYDYEQAKKFIPNYIRIVLETFLTFKFCIVKKDKSGLNQVSNKMLENLSHFNNFQPIGNIRKNNLKEKLHNIRRVTNHQSHGSPQSLDKFNFISEAELKQISKDTLNIISFLDQIHYQAINKELKTTP